MTKAFGEWTERRAFVIGGTILGALLVSAVLVAILYEQVGTWRDAAVVKQVGRSVDVGGRTLDIHCVGEGRPTVIFDSGRTLPGYVWTPSQRLVFQRGWIDLQRRFAERSR